MPPNKMPAHLILEIRAFCAAGKTPKEVAALFGLNRQTISAIINGTTYPEVGGPLRARRDRLPVGASVDLVREEGRRRIRARSRVADNGCWLWEDGAVDAKGYALLAFAGETTAHRVSYKLFNGSIPDGCEVDHLCHTADPLCFAGNGDLHRRCVRPDHLAAVPHALNVQRGRGWAIHGLKMSCPQGHPYDDTNTFYKRRRDGGVVRVCRECGRQYMRRRRAAARDGTAVPVVRKPAES